MRPLRFLLIITTSILAFFSLLFLGPWSRSTAAALPDDLPTSGGSSLGAFFNWRTPSSLFPPSAIISLTDDNSTFFLARPAAFGPLLPGKSLSAQLWVGSGFGSEATSLSGGGELGCSDVPGWVEGDGKTQRKGGEGRDKVSEAGKEKRSEEYEYDFVSEEYEDLESASKEPSQDDGTDDHLHHPLPASEAVKQHAQNGGTVSKKPTHADIQSLQESAEIAGKVVLLSRGGCGFLEKAKWVQRRGGVALIVGDDIRGGPLVTMYARGDTSNITIPALFTSHTTAHLLSSLIPLGGRFEDLTAEEAARLGLAFGGRGEDGAGEKPTFTTTTAALKGTATAKAQHGHKKQTSPLREPQSQEEEQAQPSNHGWLRSHFGSTRVTPDSRRPPSSGHIDWVLQREFEEDERPLNAKIATTSTSPAKHLATKRPVAEKGDGFVIGVQDWRDKDLMAEQQNEVEGKTGSSTSQASTAKSTQLIGEAELRGGSITPGSGEYGKPAHLQPVDTAGEKAKSKGKDAATPSHQVSKNGQDKNKKKGSNWFSRLFSSSPTPRVSTTSDKHDTAKTHRPTNPQAPKSHPAAPEPHRNNNLLPSHSGHKGLWVTLTPTSMSSSPFFDTLLVLVVSPLVTLTVVYALLLLRSRIRRRRWRAPKSVVERLPVRTYQTMAESPTTTSSSSGEGRSRQGSAFRDAAASALLEEQQSAVTTTTAARPIRPRSRTSPSSSHSSSSSSLPEDAGLAAAASHATESAALASSTSSAAGLAEWRRKYGGRQRECVVCLEEYVEGVSRVMSLPCGHEFHEGCITPWLTTRRRTCPICKADIVRSLARSSFLPPLSSPSSTPSSLPQPLSLPPAVAALQLPATAPTSSSLPSESATRRFRNEPAEAGEREGLLGGSRESEDVREAREVVSREVEADEDLERGER